MKQLFNVMTIDDYGYVTDFYVASEREAQLLYHDLAQYGYQSNVTVCDPEFVSMFYTDKEFQKACNVVKELFGPNFESVTLIGPADIDTFM